MQETVGARWWRGRDRPGWKNFGIAMLVLSVALLVSLFSAAAAQSGRILVAAGATVVALGMAGWVAITIVPVASSIGRSAGRRGDPPSHNAPKPRSWASFAASP